MTAYSCVGQRMEMGGKALVQYEQSPGFDSPALSEKGGRSMKHCEVSDISPQKHAFQPQLETRDTLEESLLLYREVQHLLE